MKKILIMGLTTNHNYGDKFIVDCVKYIIERDNDCNAEEMDFESPMGGLKALLYYCLLCISKICSKSVIGSKILYFAVNIRCGNVYKGKIQSSDAVIFGGGSFKYGTQKMWAYYSLAIEIAKKYNIPVMFDGMNIQKYDEKNWKCLFLNEHANYSNVKMITSRDGNCGVLRLRDDYRIKQEIVCESVGDPAFWIPECYNVTRNTQSKMVGINLIYGQIYRRYGNSIKEKELLEIYSGLLDKLNRAKIPWELFTNGLEIDLKFGKKIEKRIGERVQIRHPQSEMELLKIIASYKVILGARLHACICAYAMKIPFVGFYWDEKLVHFAEMIKGEELFEKEKNISSERLFEKIEKIYTKESFQYDIDNYLYWKERTKFYLDSFVDSLG